MDVSKFKYAIEKISDHNPIVAEFNLWNWQIDDKIKIRWSV